ncbi:MAG: hypothetical protein AAFV19_11105 [Pseudomonadota bacterium]
MALVYLLCLLVLILYFWRNPVRLRRDDGMPDGPGWNAGRACDWIADPRQPKWQTRRRWICRKCKLTTAIEGQARPSVCMRESGGKS